MTIEEADRMLSGYISILLRALLAVRDLEIERLTAQNQRLQAELEAAIHNEEGRTHPLLQRRKLQLQNSCGS